MQQTKTIEIYSLKHADEQHDSAAATDECDIFKEWAEKINHIIGMKVCLFIKAILNVDLGLVII